jgi:long-chain acyl-CoA synthetase
MLGSMERMDPSALQLSLASVLHEAARRWPGKVAAIEGAREITYGALAADVLAAAGELERLGVAPGDRVALLAPNTIGFVTAYHAILTRGAVVVPVAPMLVAEEIGHLLADSGAAIVLADASLAERVGSADGGARVLSIDALLHAAAAGEPQRAPQPRDPLDPAVLFYTSGTTGRSKGAVLAHLNLVMNCFVNAFMANEIRHDDVVLACLPLFHTFGQTVAMNSSFLVGGRIVLQPRFEGEQALELIRRHGVTVMLGVPTMYIALLAAAAGDDRGAPSLRQCISGGAPLPVSVLEAWNARFDAPIQEGYGLSETSPTATVNQHAFGLQAGSIGHPLWGVEVEIADAAIEDRIVLLGDDTLGELVIRGHNAFLGYHDDPEATRAAVVDGWFRTGDLGVRDPDGFLRVVDRKKDLILRGGYNVYPREVEEVLARHPDVEQVAVIGVPHETLGEEVLAVVVARAGSGADPDEILAWGGERIARHKRPRRVELVDELPLGPSRKVLKRELRDRFA